MKKREAIKAINPAKAIEDNLEAAQYGRFAGTPALAAWKEFRMADCAAECEGLKAHREPILLDGMKDIVAALKRQDAQFFRTLADLFDSIDEVPGPASPVWERAATYLWAEQRKIRYGARKAPITHEELTDYLNKQFAEGIDARTFSRIVKALGIPLKRGRSGPKAERQARQ